MVTSPDKLLEIIHQYKLIAVSNRLIGAYQFLKEDRMAKILQSGMEALGAKVSPTNPFVHHIPTINVKEKSSHSLRIITMWQQYRRVIIDLFPKYTLTEKKKQNYFQKLEKIYEEDAYNSLSIEGFEVSEELIEKVKDQKWNPDESKKDNNLQNALSAKGYLLAFQAVEESIKKMSKEENSGTVIQNDLQGWYQKLFGPFVDVQILVTIDLLRYRKHQVYIRNSRHIPFSTEALTKSMETFFDCLANEKEASVRGVLGHFIFVFIHPYMDGNGRLGRFLMNALFASGGYPWTIIHVERRSEYLRSLEKASVENDINLLLNLFFLAWSINRSNDSVFYTYWINQYFRVIYREKHKRFRRAEASSLFL